MKSRNAAFRRGYDQPIAETSNKYLKVTDALCALVETGELATRSREESHSEYSAPTFVLHSNCEAIVDSEALFNEITNLPNQHFMLRYVDDLSRLSSLRGSEFSMVLLSLDCGANASSMKSQPEYERVLKQLSDILRLSIHPSDFAGHWKGDEFLILLPSTSIESAHSWVKALRQHWMQSSIVQMNSSTDWALNIGIASSPESSDLLTLLDRTSHALELAKRRGGNRVCKW